ncbi:MAG: 3-phosphoserine/phosphohydroxythreonine transaminase [Chitinophagales bacterium]|nr:3-phosphoserine/phosphohydroxythreonine transaminase [Chitinophagaceae bacterium]MCB9064147.1 3-phosphoserine/phosphohydroxythreonine transaminase [Chitinophagales bacterium]
MIPSYRVINFNAGPATLPPEVLKEASDAIIDYAGTGTSILSIPHRGKHFDAILEESKALVKELCELDDDYEVLWMQGGGRLQFAMVPMNFLGKDDTAGYIDSGRWSADAIKNALHYGKVNVLSSSKDENYTQLPEWPKKIPNDLAYLHITTNNTIHGTQLKKIPSTDVPLIADLSSDIFSRQIKYNRFSLFYAVAQKNIGPAGATLVVVKKKMLKRVARTLPPILDYRQHVDKNSVLNTPPVFSIYVSLLTLRWIKAKGIAAIEAENERKAALLYDEIKRNALFSSAIKKSDRSTMNVCFETVNEETVLLFVKYAEENGIINIKGHRKRGGLRVSLYNGISLSDVQYLVAVMQQFEQNLNKR